MARATDAGGVAGSPGRWPGRAAPLAPYLAWAGSAALFARYLRRGWVPHDEGSVAYVAERLLRGELPHRDFADVYTGGLTYLNALGFKLLGVNLVTPRVVLLLFALAWVPAVYAIARRFLTPWGAAALTLLAAAWGPPNYFAALPSWYNLFLATWGTAALLRHLETRRPGWAFAAGACGGFSVLAKVSGVFFLAAAAFALVYDEQRRSRGPGQAAASPAYRTLVVAAALAGAVACAAMAASHPSASWIWHFALPAAGLAGLLLWTEFSSPAISGSLARARRLGRGLLPLAAGAALPPALFAARFAAAGALGDLLRGVFVSPSLRLTAVTYDFPPFAVALLFLAPPALLLALRRAPVALCAGCAAAVVAAVALAPVSVWAFRGVFLAMRTGIPLAVLAGCVALARRPLPREGDPDPAPAVLAVLATAGWCSLVQYPFPAPVYFCYVAPLAVLAVAAARSLLPARPPWVGGPLLAGALAYAVLWMTPGFIYTMGDRYGRPGLDAPLALPRGGITVSREDAQVYTALVGELQRRAAGGAVYAGPDAAEVYFLSGLRNPGRAQYELFEDPREFLRGLLPSLRAAGVRAAALNLQPWFSREILPEVGARVAAELPRARAIGRFEVRWRE